MKKFNSEYFSLWQELYLEFLLEIKYRKKSNLNNNKIIIVVPCLIGEFVASIPAIFSFIQNNPAKEVDLLVTTPTRILAERIGGVKHVYTGASVYKRENEDFNSECDFGDYEKIIVLRISRSIYNSLRSAKGEIKTIYFKKIDYTFHLIWSIILGKYPKTWKKLNLEFLSNGIEPTQDFKQMLNITQKDYEFLNTAEYFKGEEKKIIIHTFTPWPMKRWDKTNWLELIKEINSFDKFRFIFVGGKDDLSNFDYIKSNISFEVESAINKTNLLETVLLLSRADFFIGIDSGPRNIAHFVNLRSITILGPGPHIYWPENDQDIILDKTNGRGVGQMFFKTTKSFINKITVREVYEAFQKLYTQGNESPRN